MEGARRFHKRFQFVRVAYREDSNSGNSSKSQGLKKEETERSDEKCSTRARHKHPARLRWARSISGSSCKVRTVPQVLKVFKPNQTSRTRHELDFIGGLQSCAQVLEMRLDTLLCALHIWDVKEVQGFARLVIYSDIQYMFNPKVPSARNLLLILQGDSYIIQSCCCEVFLYKLLNTLNIGY